MGTTDSVHDPEHERRLVEYAAGDLNAESTAVRALRASCPRCAAEFSALDQLRGALDRDAADERAALAAAASSVGRASPRRWGWFAAAAALLVAGVVGWQLLATRQPAGAEGEIALGSELRAVAPIAATDPFDHFEWRGALEIGDRFVLTVFAADAPAGARPLFGPVRVDANSYTLRGVELPDAIRWEIERLTDSGSSQGSASTTVRRTPR